MSGKYTWKLIVTAVAIVWAVLNLVPVSNTEFQDYVQQNATGEGWQAVYDKAKARLDSKQDQTFFVALRNVVNADRVDVAKFFPFLNLESALSLRKKNNIALDGLLLRSRGQVQYGLDLAGGVAFTLEMSGPKATDPADAHQDSLSDAIRIISDRVDALGVAEPVIRTVGNNRIEVQLAGVSTKDNPDIINVLKKPARLEFKRVHQTISPEMITSPDQIPPDYIEMLYESERQGKPFEERLFVKRRADLTGKHVDRAGWRPDNFGSPEVILSLTSEGGDLFGQVTGEIFRESQRNGIEGRGRLAIILDGKVQSAPQVLGAITGGSAQISGGFTDREADDLSKILNNPLDRELNVVEIAEIGATLADDAVSSGLKAFIIGTALTVGFIAVYYTSAGMLAVIAMAINVLIILGVMCSQAVGATLSMPGIAGIVLTIAMSVDSNILIFERMREEMAVGKNLRASLEAGFEKAFTAIFDSNVTTLLTAVIMILAGTGPVKGFGVTLTIGIFSTMFAALVVSRLLLELLVFAGGVQKIKFLSIVPETKFDFMKWAKPSFITSWAIVLAGLAVVLYKGDGIYGVDFRGGDEVTITFERKLELDQIDAAATAVGLKGSEFSRNYQQPLGGGRETLKIVTPFEQGNTVLAKMQELYPDAKLESGGALGIGPSISGEIKWKAFLAIALSLVGILLYVAFRFEMGYGIGAVVSTVHDVFMTIGVFVLLGGQFNSAMIGAILLIVGYSINDTIVVFDRIREELHLNPNARLRDIINLSLNKTLARTIITGGTTFGTAITLALLTTDVVHDISVTLIIGIITGTFSSVFIASPIFFWWHKGDRKHVEESHDITPKYEWSATSKAAE